MYVCMYVYHLTGVQTSGVIVVYCDSAVSNDPKLADFLFGFFNFFRSCYLQIVRLSSRYRPTSFLNLDAIKDSM